MADNYLERKMEEHRNGGSAYRPVRKVSVAGNRPGVWQLPFAERRVLVTGSGAEIDRMIVEQLRCTGCKVAFMGGDKAESTELARRVGAQWHPVEYGDGEALLRSVAIICRAWGDIDAVVSTIGAVPEAVLSGWLKHRAEKPYPNPFGGRIVMTEPVEMPLPHSIMESLKQFGITATTVAGDTVNDTTVAAMMAINYNIKVVSDPCGQ